jgi:hypothetical protein
MQILVRHDDTIRGGERLSELAQSTLDDQLGRFAQHITTVECHFAEEAGEVRSTLEVRFEGQKPLACSHHAHDLPVSLSAAADKMVRMLDHRLGRIRDGLREPIVT